MDSIKYSTFDFFRYIMPGVFYLVVVSITVNPLIKDLPSLIEFLSTVDAEMIILMVILGYILGFALDPIGLKLVSIAQKMWVDKLRFNVSSNLGATEKYLLVRKNVPDLYVYIEKWFMLAGMSGNLSLGMLLLMLTSIIKIVQNYQSNYWVWVIIFSASSVLSVILLKRGETFTRWANRELHCAIDLFDLEENGLTLDSK